ncbi:MAG TPA: hypothetical protein VHD90_07580 [Phototrophicaceae bacterium]|nr:hypothetical protein [Phototrophicaceae bacterium]
MLKFDEKQVQFTPDAYVVLGGISQAESLQRTAMVRKFLPPLRDDATPEEKDVDVQRWNFIVLSGVTRAQVGFELALAQAADTEAEFEQKFAAYLALDHRVCEAWIEGATDISKSLAPRVQLPEAYLTKAELADPSSSATGGTKNRKSDASSGRGRQPS